MTTRKTTFTLLRDKLAAFADFSSMTGIALDVGEVEQDETLYRLTWFPASPEEEQLLADHMISVGYTTPLAWEEVIEENWQEKALADFPPIHIGQFVITRNDEDIAEDKIRLRIPAAMAFGSGEHATTAACLHLYQRLPMPEISSILDMGCGSGILAIGAAKRDGRDALCVDIHDLSVEICDENARDNDVESHITSVLGDGFETPEVQAQKPFSLIFANILADPLIQMAPALNGALADGGYAIISGFLQEQEERVAAAYLQQGLTQIDRQSENQGPDAWVALTFCKREICS